MNTPKVNLLYIKQLREEKNISVEQMSKLLGYVGYQGYYYKEKGIRKMSAEDIALVAMTLGVPIESLFLK
ncbi:helix-turn-helix transcriptional regulator [Rummeliibacillus sp. POC4]|uniref:helix-turn-helix domain-containing protein n=1 Tax=Rummeliibacillus sp. POC4 TaxID=2305899 RepID=UPI001F460385|nr:helix-turn-helix transcriptional regulator [Rummeliibacillus sp. POC4]